MIYIYIYIYIYTHIYIHTHTHTYMYINTHSISQKWDMSKLWPKCQYLILLGMEFTRAAQVVAGILFHSSNNITELLDVRHMVLLHLPLEDTPHVRNGVQVWRYTWPLHHLHLQQQGSCHLGGVFGVIMLENSFWREGIIFCFRMSQYMNRSSPVPAVVMQPQTMMLPPTCLTVCKAQFSWYSSPGYRHTCCTVYTIWVKQVYLRLHYMVPVIHALSQVVFNCLQAFLWANFRRGFLLGQWPCKPTCCSVWRMVWAMTSWPSTSTTSKAMLAALMRLFLHLMQSTRTQHLWSTLARPVPSETRLGKPLSDPCH